MQHIPVFDVGAVVRHRTKDYRGVVIAWDPERRTAAAQNDDTAGADPHRPWYRVLVHGEGYTTYVPEEHLAKDTTGEQVIHPMIKSFFRSFRDGRYLPE